MRKLFSLFFICSHLNANAQVKWENVDSLYQPLPEGFHVYKTTTQVDGKPNIAYYAEADLSRKNLVFSADTSWQRRLTPLEFYRKGSEMSNSFRFPVLVVNTTFFSFATNQNLNVVIKNSKLLAHNVHSVPARGKDTFTYRHPYTGAIGITKRGKADIAWIFTDSAGRRAFASQEPVKLVRDSIKLHSKKDALKASSFRKWKMKTAVGGGPVLIQNGEIMITNNEEWKFAGNAVKDKHPRTAMGYTANGKLIIMVVEGRHPGTAEGASLTQLAQMLKDIGCEEALNLDGGGSSCMLINGKETIRVSDANGQRPVPAVFMIMTQ